MSICLSGPSPVFLKPCGSFAGTITTSPPRTTRSGDTEDAWLADLAVGWDAGQIKIGSTTRSERTAKWNRLLQLEARAAGGATFAGRAALGGTRSAA